MLIRLPALVKAIINVGGVGAESLLETTLQLLYKRTGSTANPANSRGICTSHMLGKLVETTLAQQFLSTAEAEHKLHESQNGFRPRRGTRDNTWLLS